MTRKSERNLLLTLGFGLGAPLLMAAGITTPPALPPAPDAETAFDSVAFSYKWHETDEIQKMDRFLVRFPSSSLAPAVRLMKGNVYFFRGAYPLAVKEYSQLAPEMFNGEERLEYAYRYGYSLIKTGYYDEAVPMIGILASGSWKWRQAGIFYGAYIDYINGEYDKAYKGFSAVQPTGEKGLEAAYYLNQIDFIRGDYRQVAESGRELLAGNVDYQLRPETMRVTGISWYKLGEDAKAKPLLEEYVEIKGDGAESTALYTLGAILYSEGDYNRASELFSSLTDERNELAQSSWLYLGQIHAAEGDERGASLAFDRASKESWDRGVAETAAYNLAVASVAGNSVPFVDAAEQVETFLISYPDSEYAPSLSKYLINAYYNQGDYKKALERIDALGSADREIETIRGKINFRLGVDAVKEGKLKEAVNYLTKASSAGNPDKEVAAQASLWLGDAYYASGDYAKAAPAYEKAAGAREIGENAAIANYDLGYARMKLKEYAKARTAFDGALKAKGLTQAQKNDAALRRADCMYYTGDYAGALKEFRSIAKGGGSDAVFASVREADILGKEGKINEKIKILTRLADSGEAGIWSSLVLNRLADAYSENGQDAKAAEIYARLLDSDTPGSDNMQLYYSLASNADKLYESGKIPEALAAYRRLEESGIAEFYPMGIIGVMRTSQKPEEVMEYAAKVEGLPGISADIKEEARFLGADAALKIGGKLRNEALQTLGELARNPGDEWGAQAALRLGRYYLDYGKPADAEKVLLALTDSDCDDSYVLAQAYILLADACKAQDKDYLARLYLETLRDNYPGKEKEIFDMIESRLKKLK